jgi:hypothetical protein
VKKIYSEHHVVPRSRWKKNRNNEKVVSLPKLFHTSWHILFLNLHGRETEEFIRIINQKMENQDTISPNEIAALREKLKKGGK